jgi:hypothetical protein
MLTFLTLRPFHLHRQVGVPLKMEQAEYSERSAYKIQTPGNYPEENIQHAEHGQSFEIKNTSPL